MLLSILLIILMTLIGLIIINLLKFKLKTIEKILVSYILGLMLTTWFIFILSLIIKNIQVAIALSFPIFIVLIIIFRKNLKIKIEFKKANLILLLIFFIFSILIATTAMPHYSQGSIMASSYAWADSPFHLSIINSFSQANNIHLDSTIYAGNKLTYPFLINFYSAILNTIDTPLLWSIMLPTILLLTSFLYLLFTLVKKLTKKRSIAIIAVLVLMLSGGLGFINFIQNSINSPQPFYQDLFLNANEYTWLEAKGFQFTNFTADLLSQRTTLIGFNILFIILILFLPHILEDKKELTKSQLIFLGIIMGLLPLFHTHSYITLFIFIIPLMLLYQKKEHLYLIIPGIILALPQFLWLSQTALANHFISFHLGWLSTTPFSFIKFWILNLGFALLLYIIGFKITKHKKMHLASLSLFLIPNLIQFQPWLFDNIKIFKLWQVFVAVLIAEAFYFIYKKSKILATILLILTISTGFLTITYILNSETTLFTPQEVEVSNWIKENTPENAVFVTNLRKHNNPILLTGRKLFLAYEGWLWSHGVPYQKRLDQTPLILIGALELNKTIATHILIDKNDNTFAYAPYLENSLEKIYETNNHLILKA